MCWVSYISACCFWNAEKLTDGLTSTHTKFWPPHICNISISVLLQTFRIITAPGSPWHLPRSLQELERCQKSLWSYTLFEITRPVFLPRCLNSLSFFRWTTSRDCLGYSGSTVFKTRRYRAGCCCNLLCRRNIGRQKGKLRCWKFCINCNKLNKFCAFYVTFT